MRRTRPWSWTSLPGTISEARTVRQKPSNTDWRRPATARASSRPGSGRPEISGGWAGATAAAASREWIALDRAAWISAIAAAGACSPWKLARLYAVHDAYGAWDLALAEAESRSGQATQANARFEQLLREHPNSRPVALTYAEILNEQGNREAGQRAQAMLRPKGRRDLQIFRCDQGVQRMRQVTGHRGRMREQRDAPAAQPLAQRAVLEQPVDAELHSARANASRWWKSGSPGGWRSAQ